MLRIGLNALLLFGLILGTGQARGQLVPVSLDYRRVGDQLVLSWTNDAFSLQAAPSMHGVFTNLQGATSPHTNTLSGTQGYFRLLGADAPAGMALIPAGSFTMGDTFSEGSTNERPTHAVYVSAFYMDRTEVTKALWDEVYLWAITHGYSFVYADSGQGKAANHPAHRMTWYDAVKWSNARSEKEGRTPAYYTSAAQTTVYRSGRVDVQNGWVKWYAGYRLPTEAEWEKAARGGASGLRFPWGNTITHSQANYYSSSSYYDTSPTRGYHPTFNDGVTPYTSPAGYFAPNGYGLYDMAGSVWEWCWDWWSITYYSSSPSTDPRGPASGTYRGLRGGSWINLAGIARCADRDYNFPDHRSYVFGFRSVRPAGQ